MAKTKKHIIENFLNFLEYNFKKENIKIYFAGEKINSLKINDNELYLDLDSGDEKYLYSDFSTIKEFQEFVDMFEIEEKRFFGFGSVV